MFELAIFRKLVEITPQSVLSRYIMISLSCQTSDEGDILSRTAIFVAFFDPFQLTAL